MAVARKKRTFARKKRTFKRHHRRGMGSSKTKSMAKVGVGIPDKMMVTLRYVDAANLALSGAANITYEYRMTSFYYPNFTTGTDHYPMFWNNYAPLYDRYVVVGAKFKITYSIPSISAFADDLVVGYYFQDNPGSVYPANLQALCEQPGAKWKVISAGATSPTGGTFYGSYSARKIFGAKVLSNTNLQATTGYGISISNSPNQWNVLLFASSMSGGAISTVVNFVIEIDYTVVFFEKHNFVMNT
nr:MAG: capsid protein [Cressdnaviricota sp.]